MDIRRTLLILLCLLCCLFTGCAQHDEELPESSAPLYIWDPGPQVYKSVDDFLDAIQSGKDWLVSEIYTPIDTLLLVEPAEGYIINNVQTYPYTGRYEYNLHPADSCVNEYEQFSFCNCEVSLTVQIYGVQDDDIKEQALQDYLGSSTADPFEYMGSTYTKHSIGGREVVLGVSDTSSYQDVRWYDEENAILLLYTLPIGGVGEEPDLTVEGELEKLVGAVAGFRTLPMEKIRLHGKGAVE